jgi:hypothetical protein
MSRFSLCAIAVAVAMTLGAGNSHAGWPKIKVGPLGPYQQKLVAHTFGAVVGAGVGVATTPVAGPYGGAVAGAAVSTAVGNHAEKKWTGNGLQNWRRPSRW